MIRSGVVTIGKASPPFATEMITGCSDARGFEEGVPCSLLPPMPQPYNKQRRAALVRGEIQGDQGAREVGYARNEEAAQAKCRKPTRTRRTLFVAEESPSSPPRFCQ